MVFLLCTVPTAPGAKGEEVKKPTAEEMAATDRAHIQGLSEEIAAEVLRGRAWVRIGVITGIAAVALWTMVAAAVIVEGPKGEIDAELQQNAIVVIRATAAMKRAAASVGACRDQLAKVSAGEIRAGDCYYAMKDGPPRWLPCSWGPVKWGKFAVTYTHGSTASPITQGLGRRPTRTDPLRGSVYEP
jgi:hypothetical protein